MKKKITLFYSLTFLSIFCFGQDATVLDTNFETYLETHDANGNVVAVGNANSMGNGTDGDGKILKDRIESVTTLTIPSLSITRLDVIKYFIGLEVLDCSDNAIETLDLTYNKALTSLTCDNNSLKTLFLKGITNLTSIDCSDNNINALYLDELTNLTTLDCSDNDLYSLNIDNSQDFTSFTALNNSNLTCIQVNSVSYMDSNFASAKDAGASYSANCTSIYIGDSVFENYLETHDRNGTIVSVGDVTSMGNGIASDNYFFKERVDTVTDLDISGLSISDLQGIEQFVALTDFDCSSTSVTSVQITSNTLLEDLNCANNSIEYIGISGLTSLTTFTGNNNSLTFPDFTSNTALLSINIASNNVQSGLNLQYNTLLQTLDCSDNSITNIDLSASTGLVSLDCSDNLLTNLNIKNTNNANLSAFDARTNSGLICIQVDDEDYMNTNYSDKIDNVSSFSEDCNDFVVTSYVADANFENYLETHDGNGNVVTLGDASSMGNGIASDQSIFASKAKKVTSLNISNLSIGDVTGINAFTALETFDCSSNSLNNLQIQTNTALTSLNCESTTISSLSLTANTALEVLNCSSNSLSNLSLNNQPDLITLNCANNSIVNLDVTANTKLTTINCASNSLTSLDIKNTNNANLVSFDATTNASLSCVQVDSKTFMDSNFASGINGGTVYSEDCSTAGLNNSFLDSLEISTLNNQISVNSVRVKIIVYNFLGKQVINQNLHGMFIVKLIDSDNNIRVQKVFL